MHRKPPKMTNRELLEMAAKAVGYEVVDWYGERYPPRHRPRRRRNWEVGGMKFELITVMHHSRTI